MTDRYGRLVAEPFEKGYALTVGNSLRRTLLAVVPGAAVSWVRIDGIKNVETKIPGVKESTVDVLLNIKKLAIQVPSGEAKVLRVEVTGPKVVTGADVPETDVEVVNPEIHLFTIESSAKVTVEVPALKTAPLEMVMFPRTVMLEVPALNRPPPESRTLLENATCAELALKVPVESVMELVMTHDPAPAFTEGSSSPRENRTSSPASRSP